MVFEAGGLGDAAPDIIGHFVVVMPKITSNATFIAETQETF